MRADRPSRSALQVARAIAFLAADEAVAPLLPPGLAPLNERLLLTVGRVSPRQLRRFRQPRFRRYIECVSRLGEPGQLLHLGIRKRLVDDLAREALGDGCRQLLVLGAGFDTLALRLAAEHPDGTFVEIDHPASQRLKRAAVAGLGGLPSNLHLLPADLANGELGAALGALPAWRGTERSFAVAEGVLMYLDQAAVIALQRQLRERAGEGSRLLFSALRRDARGRLRLGHRPRLAAAFLALAGEPLRWAPADGELAATLGAGGWRLLVERFDLRQRYLAPAGLADRELGSIEIFSLAERS